MTSLQEQSIDVILANQAPTGAYVACPHFPTYRYTWFRDGAFIAYAMDLVGQHDSARRFHDWVAHTVLRHAEDAEGAIEKARRGDSLDEGYLHTRYTPGGEIGSDEWPNFQLDGLGAWLWALAEHDHRRATADHHSLPTPWQQAVDLTARYLTALWTHPCYDLWEEHPQHLHPYTLAAIYAGLKVAESTGAGGGSAAAMEEIRRFVLERGVRDGHLIKHIDPPVGGGAEGQGSRGAGVRRSGGAEESPRRPGAPAQIDASLIGVATPYRLLTPDDPRMQATVARIEAELHRPGGGLYRYGADTYYGGGEWVLLAAWLGWHYAQAGEMARAVELLRWVEAQADVEGHLPEQVSTHLLAPERYAEWEARWGPVAKPLLWSHAMYLILHQTLRAADVTV